MPEKQVNQSFWEHFAELGKRVKIVLVTFIVAVMVMLILPGNSDFFALTNNYEPLMSLFLKYIRTLVLPLDVKLFTASFSDAITLYVYAAFLFGIILTLPVFAYETFKFVEPALYLHEKRALYPFVTIVTVLFVAGAAFGFFFLSPVFINSMLAFFYPVGAEPWIPIMDFYNLFFFTIIVSGFIFTIPAFFVLLVKFGVIRTSLFTKKRKYVYAGLVVLALLISPGATPQGDLYLFIALAILFEVSMISGKYFERNADPNSTPSILKLFAEPKKTCNYCHIETTSSFCPRCKRALT